MAKGKIRILYVEDEEIDRIAVERLVKKERLPYELVAAGTVADAAAQLSRNRIDFVLIDYNLPDGSGLEVQEQAGDIPCIYLTAADDYTVAVEVMKAGAYDFLVKDSRQEYLKLLPSVIQAALERRKARDQIRLQQQVISSIDEMVLLTDSNGDIIFSNAAVEPVLGYKPEEIMGKGWWNLLFSDPNKRKNLRTLAAAKAKSKESPGTYDLELQHRDGSRIWTAWIESRGPEGTLICVGRNITERMQAEEALFESEKRYRRLVELSPDLIVLHSIEKILYINPAGVNKLGALSPDDLTGKSLFDFVHQDQKEQILKRFKDSYECRKEQDPIALEVTLTGLDGRSIDFEIIVSPVQVLKTFALQIVGRDISKRKKVEKLLKELTVTDTLTGLSNRRKFFEHLNILWRQNIRNKIMLSLLMIDIDNFKTYNDTYGHPAGDACLKKVADVLSASTSRPGDIVARYGGEEFIAVLPGTDLEGAQHIAEVMRKGVMDRHIEHKESQAAPYVTISIGVASTIPEKGLNYESLVSLADQALYKAKDEGKNRVFSLHQSKVIE